MQASIWRWRPLVALGLAAFFAFAVWTLPASLALSRLRSIGVETAGVSGTIWRGEAQVLLVRGVRVGRVQWTLHAAPLLIGRLAADLKVARIDGFLETALAASPSGRLRFENLSGSLPLSALPPQMLRGGWSGTLNLKFDELVLEEGWPTSATGTLQALDITGPVESPANLGSYKVSFAGDDDKTDALTGQIVDMGGPLQVSGALHLKAQDRSYLIEGYVASRADASRALQNALQVLGPPDEQGRRQFGVEGTL
ncbi:MAG TPA: type II secretion system protein N [Steroidobacter sp.]|jgi:hypothetical protein|nr:type II secretion system protein N [Steroidobacter sp.]